MSPTMQKLRSVLPRELGSAWHMAVPQTPVYQDWRHLLATAASSPWSMKKHTHAQPQHLQLASYWGKDLVSLAPAMAGFEEQLVSWSREQTGPWVCRQEERTSSEAAAKSYNHVLLLAKLGCRRGRVNVSLLCPRNGGKAARTEPKTV